MLEYLGHVIDGLGLHPTMDKVKVIQEAPQPHNVTELSKYLPNLSTKLAPLYDY